MQPAQLSLIPHEGWTPAPDLLAQLPAEEVAIAIGELARVIANAAEVSGEVIGDE